MEGTKESIVNIETEQREVSPTKDICSSKAVSSAMKALQIKIRALESENASLKLKCEDLENSEVAYQRKVEYLNGQLEDCLLALNKAQENAEIFECKFNQILHENKLIVEEFGIEKEHFALKVQELITELEDLKSSENEEKAKLRGKLKDLNEITLEVTNQLESNSKKLENSRTYYEEICSSYENDLENLKDAVDVLEKNCEDLKLQADNKDKKVVFLQEKIEEINQIHEEDRNSLVQQCNEAQEFITRLSQKINKHQQKKSFRKKKITRVKSENMNKKIESRISNKEGEICNLNQQYRNLLQQSYNEHEGNLTVKSQLYTIARKIEENNESIKKLRLRTGT